MVTKNSERTGLRSWGSRLDFRYDSLSVQSKLVGEQFTLPVEGGMQCNVLNIIKLYKQLHKVSYTTDLSWLE